MWNDVAELVSITKITDDVGDTIEKENAYQVFCNEVSIRQSEFYQAMATGIKPEITLEIHRFEYENQKRVRYKNKIYEVIRTFSKNEEVLEITLGGGVHGTT